MDKSVLVGMSGGVDSAVAAALLLEQGYRVVGCTLRLWDGPAADGGCCSLEDVEDARSTARRLGIDYYVFNFSGTFRAQVVEDFIRCYRAGDTPNPCVRCNRYAKFPALLRRADDLGIGHIATGHYARVGREDGRWTLRKGLDGRKDQSYFLYPLPQETLSRLLLPLGGLDKAAVRAIAEERGLASAHKRDSQDICFVPGGDYAGFLEERGVEFPPGDFVDIDGNVLGRHHGLARYTTGQRRGLGIGGSAEPLYVLRKDAASNTVVLGRETGLYTSAAEAEDFQWVSLPPGDAPLAVAAKTRYSQTEARGVLYPESGTRVRVAFEKPQRAVTRGQSLVAYRGDTVIGGGIITGTW